MNKSTPVSALLGVFLLICLLANAAPFAQKPGLFTTEITAVTSDALVIHGWLTFTPDKPKAPLVVLLPMLGNDHTSYDDLVQVLIEKSLLAKQPVPYILAVDMRGHGKSTKKGSTTLSAESMAVEEFVKCPIDVASIIRTAVHDTACHIDSTDIRVIGASIGANTAALLTQQLPGVTRIVLLSPGEAYRGLKPTDALKTFHGNTMLVASDKDEYSFASVTSIAKLVPSAKLLTYAGDRHGTDITNQLPDAMSAVATWVLQK